ncbi:hypothetical protein Tco_0758944 [Tanacetum coccineum]
MFTSPLHPSSTHPHNDNHHDHHRHHNTPPPPNHHCYLCPNPRPRHLPLLAISPRPPIIQRHLPPPHQLYSPLHFSFQEAASINWHFCRYLFYLGKIRTIQLEYTYAKESLLQAAREAPVAALGF